MSTRPNLWLRAIGHESGRFGTGPEVTSEGGLVLSPLDSAPARAEFERAPELLILDDDDGVFATLSVMLDISGLQIHSASTCSDALEILRRHPQVNVVLADVCLQGEDGLAFAGSIQQQLGGRAWLQVIVMTGQPRLDFAISAVRNNVNDFLLKPIKRHDLNVAVQSAIDRSVLKLRQSYMHNWVRQSLERLRREFEEATSDVGRAGEQGSLAEPNWQEIAASRPTGIQNPANGIGPLLDWMDLRDRYFGSLFCDPAWNIMLELYQAKMEGRPVSIKRACIAAKVPATTALRRLSDLEGAGLVAKQADGADKRRLLVELTPSADERMAECLTSLFEGINPTTRV